MTRLPLPGTFDLPAVIQLAGKLRSTSGPVVLDGAAVERIGIPGLQLLLSAQATAQAGGKMFEIRHPSNALITAANTAGANEIIGIGSCDAI
ncbi:MULTISPECIES: STAS domain-containing protein [unclassified Sphingomonas]|uniref:STAS domain-containing protein n=1 Tax=unclassified Sphingomonas TaxID=196159 RepID=UPI00226A9266|nr:MULTISPECIES: STAS domain-containing protein [unclassified Sphingomonas]